MPMKPAWLSKKISLNACSQMKGFLRGLHVETVCEQAMCPNIGECFSRRQATFLILGRRCTRGCRFCNIEKGIPQAPDPDEPERVAEAVARLGLRHVVITSVTRDDLPDGGAQAFSLAASRVRLRSPGTAIELLIPDFGLQDGALRLVSRAPVEIIAHNVETVPSLYPFVRQGSQYTRSLEVLRRIKSLSAVIKVKSGIMVGLGETPSEVAGVMGDLRKAGCEYLSIGQYLAPSTGHYPVKEYVLPERFREYKQAGMEMGFSHIESGPYVRSSYMAEGYLTGKANPEEEEACVRRGE